MVWHGGRACTSVCWSVSRQCLHAHLRAAEREPRKLGQSASGAWGVACGAGTKFCRAERKCRREQACALSRSWPDCRKVLRAHHHPPFLLTHQQSSPSPSCYCLGRSNQSVLAVSSLCTTSPSLALHPSPGAAVSPSAPSLFRSKHDLTPAQVLSGPLHLSPSFSGAAA